jgi:thiamine-phosphate pyrophosphorylase
LAQPAFPTLNGLYAITDPTLLGGEVLLTAVEDALANGVRILQYRDKLRPLASKVAEASRLQSLCRKHGATFLVNDDIDLCQAVNADGVHLGQNDTSVIEARRRLGPQAVIGVSCHNSPELVAAAERDGASYVALGRFYPSLTKPDAPQARINDLRRIRAQTNLPIAAIGGITAENGSELLTAGADMLAVVHYLFSTPDVAIRTKALMRLF